jgi:hydroxymethylglutaryl-CoA lyase
MKLPKQIILCDVCPRDGFQMESSWIPTDQKVEIIEAIAASGVPEIEVTSFVHPRAIPQLKDAEEVVARVNHLNVRFRALVPNLRGAERAVSSGIKKLKLMLSATESHSKANANCTVDEALHQLQPVIEFASKHSAQVSGSISVAFGCPYEGKTPNSQILKIMNRYKEYGVKEVSLADTTGMANPLQVSQTLELLLGYFPEMVFSMHLHNTRDMAIANAVAAMQLGVNKFDSSTAGLGGCPYAPGATGNLSTEDFVHALHEMEMDTGVDLDKVISNARLIQSILGKESGSFILKAGKNTDLYHSPKEQHKLI